MKHFIFAFFLFTSPLALAQEADDIIQVEVKDGKAEFLSKTSIHNVIRFNTIPKDEKITDYPGGDGQSFYYDSFNYHDVLISSIGKNRNKPGLRRLYDIGNQSSFDFYNKTGGNHLIPGLGSHLGYFKRNGNSVLFSFDRVNEPINAIGLNFGSIQTPTACCVEQVVTFTFTDGSVKHINLVKELSFERSHKQFTGFHISNGYLKSALFETLGHNTILDNIYWGLSKPDDERRHIIINFSTYQKDDDQPLSDSITMNVKGVDTPSSLYSELMLGYGETAEKLNLVGDIALAIGNFAREIKKPILSPFLIYLSEGIETTSRGFSRIMEHYEDPFREEKNTPPHGVRKDFDIISEYNPTESDFNFREEFPQDSNDYIKTLDDAFFQLEYSLNHLELANVTLKRMFGAINEQEVAARNSQMVTFVSLMAEAEVSASNAKEQLQLAITDLRESGIYELGDLSIEEIDNIESMITSLAKGLFDARLSTIIMRKSNLEDVVQPSLTPPPPLIISTDSLDTVTVENAEIQAFLNSASAADNSAHPVEITNDAPQTFGFGSTSVVFSARDASGNSSFGTSSVTVDYVDTISPELIPPRPIGVISSNGQPISRRYSRIESFLTDYMVSDNFDQISLLTVENNAPDIFELGETSVLFTARDRDGNLSSATSSVTVLLEDSEPPTIIVPPSISLNTSSVNGVNSSILEINEFLTSVQVFDSVDDYVEVTNNAPILFPIGTTEVTFIATDYSDNQTIASGYIEIVFVNNEPPIVNVPQPIEITTNINRALPVTNSDITSFLSSASATDETDGSVAVTHNAPDSFPMGVTTVTFSATDSAGKTGAATSTVTLAFQDVSAPVVTAPPPLNLVSNSKLGMAATSPHIADFLSSASATDETDNSVTITHDAPGLFPIGITTVTFSATDSAGNTSAATSTVTLTFEDVSAPVVTAPSPLGLVSNNTWGMAATRAHIADFLNSASAKDETDNSVSITHDAPDLFPIGVTTVTFSATDSAGNIGTAKSTITLLARLNRH